MSQRRAGKMNEKNPIGNIAKNKMKIHLKKNKLDEGVGKVKMIKKRNYGVKKEEGEVKLSSTSGRDKKKKYNLRKKLKKK
jgi:hypothetical protein